MRLIFLTIIFFMFSLIDSSFAEPFDTGNFTFGTELAQITYKEPGVMKQSGLMNGVVASYTYFNNILIRAKIRASYGQVDYTSTDTGDMDSVDDYLLETTGITGFNLCSWSDHTVIIPYLGFGYRYLSDDSQGRTTTTGALGYKRESNYYYSPIGIEAASEIGYGLSVGAILEYDYFLKGVQKSYLSGAIVALGDIENDQNKGYGYRACIKIRKETANITFILEPFIRYWKIEQSESVNITFSGVIIGFGYEPKNYSTEYGIKLAINF